jgi:lipopolysaccharide export system protein LptA
MKTIKFLSVLFLSANCGLAGAQTNTPAKNPTAQEVEIDSGSGYFDGITNQIVYTGHVFVTDHVKAWLNCERLTVDLPPNGGHPTNIVAETNVVIDVLDQGQTNHITADKAIYTYQLLNPVTNVVAAITNVTYAVTNETVTFIGGNPMPKVENPGYIIFGDPLVFNLTTKKFDGIQRSFAKPRPGSSNGTNASPFDFMK